MLFNLRRKLMRWNFDRQLGAIYETAPVRVVDAGWSIVSMIRNRDVTMYLLAIKAFYSHLGAGHVIGIIDRDMPPASRDTLRRHVDGIELLIREDLDTGALPHGSTWERLVFMLDRAKQQYMVQMDADILAVGPDLDEVKDCIARNVAFTMADGEPFRTMRDAARVAQQDTSNFIGIAAERSFDQYPDCDKWRYIRGSSGFAGFTGGGFGRAQLEQFYQTMQGLLPTRWQEWGNEQCASNFAVANSAGAVALPYPAYGSFSPEMRSDDCKCYHFIGTYRFMDGYYARRGRGVIQRLQHTG
jgi:hypothetical protein